MILKLIIFTANEAKDVWLKKVKRSTHINLNEMILDLLPYVT